ncbi:hypothetical protein GLAREA_09602 [Glarea lozoyensis ATCC 20868]|uniref:Uncharacterized protein n=1 Tax=Glarea lozoyensis (strain ATCC 20868 / MF5171) TaxID=1116229 RepID=S3D904_GLAL2|nr:uncharacterized protein GLAREA_09602 [Glarea lozoyensis ATCC 20868]EPE28481.1 hypothetical protein GLAREA_09602 [Glarea lozoyensis ATCC 20868]
MRFSTLSTFGFLGFALLAECNPVGLPLEADKHPAVIEPSAKNPLHSRAAPSCPMKKNKEKVAARAAGVEIPSFLNRRVTEDDCLDLEIKYCNKADDIAELKVDIAEMTPGSSAKKAAEKRLKKMKNSLAQIRTAWDRCEDELARGR